MTPAYLAALQAVATAAETLTDDCERGVDGPLLARSLHALCNATKALRALPESGEEALKPGSSVVCCKRADGDEVAVRVTMEDVMIIFRGDDGVLGSIYLTHAQAAELRAVLARVRVP